YVWEPSAATHLMFFFVATSHVVGGFFIAETMLRSGVPPHMGQSPVPGSEAQSRASASASAKAQLRVHFKIFFIGSPLSSDYRNKLRTGRRRIFQDCPACSVEDRCARWSRPQAQDRWPATPCRARSLCHRAYSRRAVSSGTRCWLSRGSWPAR